MCDGAPVRSTAPTAIRDINTAPPAQVIACAIDGHTIPAANRNAPSGGPTSWLSVIRPTLMRALATPRSRLSTIIGSSVPVVMSANVSAVPSRNIAASTMPTLTTSVAIDSASTASTTARATLTAITISRRSWRSAITPACSPNSSHGRRCSNPARATSNGSSVCDATSSGPAATAIPSPRLLTHDDESNHRNPVPIRGGATASSILFIGQRRIVTPRRRSSGGCRRARPGA